MLKTKIKKHIDLSVLKSIIFFLSLLFIINCSSQKSGVIEVISEEPLGKIDIFIKHYFEEEGKADMFFREISIPSSRYNYYLSGNNINEPLKIGIIFTSEGYYSVHIVGYRTDNIETDSGNTDASSDAGSNGVSSNYYVATRCYNVSGDFIDTKVLLVGISKENDQDEDNVPDDYTQYCNHKKELGYNCEDECLSSDFLAAQDCSPMDNTINPFVEDLCGDGIDKDCWAGDEQCEDLDGDEYPSNIDCNDDNSDIYPGAPEICSNGIDENCSTDLAGCNDGDLPCDNDSDNFYENLYHGCGTDCNDNDPNINPNSEELCGEQNGNEIDEDCDGFIDEGCKSDDLDGDGFVAVDVGGDDCNDCDPGINPDISERVTLCSDGVDQNCDGIEDKCINGDQDRDWYLSPDDCNDSNSKIYPGAFDICGDDEAFNCTLETTCDVDLDGDRYNSSDDCDDSNNSVNPIIEGDICEDEIDNNCNSIVNEVWDHSIGCIIGFEGYRQITFNNNIEHCGICRNDCRTGASDKIHSIGDRCNDGLCQCGSDNELCPVGSPEELWVCCFAGEDSYCADLYHNNTIASKSDCGVCGNICDYGDGITKGQDCIEGNCLCNSLDEYIECEIGMTCCRGSGCKNLSNDLSNCGNCGNDCNENVTIPYRQVADRCIEGSCRCGPLGPCTNGTWCINDPRTESGKNCLNLDIDRNNCGAVEHVCGSNSYCLNGYCICRANYGDCNGNGSGDDIDGCETDKLVDEVNCGYCGHRCGIGVLCDNGNCACGEGGDCPNNEVCCLNQYCSNVNVDSNNCGTCGNSCGQNSNCVNGNCGCNAPYVNCINDWSDGCETNLQSDINNCSECGNICSSENAIAQDCISGNCIFACNETYYNCNDDWNDGCECNTCCSGENCVIIGEGDFGDGCCTTCDINKNTVCANNECQCMNGYTECEGICRQTETGVCCNNVWYPGSQCCISSDCLPPNNICTSDHQCAICNDNDGDNFGDGGGCPNGYDCNDNVSVCNTDCSDNDNDQIEDCNFCPQNPVEIGSYTELFNVKGVFVTGFYAYTVDYINGLSIIDISTIRTPQKVGSNIILSNPNHLTVSYPYAYIANGNNVLEIIDITNINSLLTVGSYETSDAVLDVFINNNKAYLANSASGLKLIDITDKTAPSEIGSYVLNNAVGIFIEPPYAYVANGNSGLSIIDTTNSLQEVGNLNTSNFTKAVWVRGNYTYLANGNAGLIVVDITEISNPQQVGMYNTPGDASSIFINGDYAYLGDGFSGLRIININNPSSPQEVGYYNINDIVNDVYVYNSYIYLGYNFSGMRIISVLCEN